jgi:hypothetical protein
LRAQSEPARSRSSTGCADRGKQQRRHPQPPIATTSSAPMPHSAAHGPRAGAGKVQAGVFGSQGPQPLSFGAVFTIRSVRFQFLPAPLLPLYISRLAPLYLFFLTEEALLKLLILSLLDLRQPHSPTPPVAWSLLCERDYRHPHHHPRYLNSSILSRWRPTTMSSGPEPALPLSGRSPLSP